MIKRILMSVPFFLSTSIFACASALPTDDVNFCSSFRTVASCYCSSSGIPAGMCQDMNSLYNRMIAAFGTLQKACEFQRHASTQDCMDNWNCYRYGGVDSKGRLCSSTQLACQ